MSQTINNFVSADNSSDIGRLKFVIDTALSGMRTAMPVQVVSVSNNGGVSPIGTVSLKPLVQGKDGGGNAIPHGVIYNCPYMRIQGGSNAIIIDPQVGDIGLGIVCDRDISAVQSSNAEAPPGSSRKNDMSDMVYLMTIISATVPVQYVEFNPQGITVTTPNKVIINAAEIDCNAPVLNINASNITSSGSWIHSNNFAVIGTMTNNGTNVGRTHTHPVRNVAGGSSTIESDVPQ